MLLFTFETMIVDMKKEPSSKKKPGAPKKPERPPLQSLPILQDDQDDLDQDMQELFNEDKVTHRHGSAEPESD